MKDQPKSAHETDNEPSSANEDGGGPSLVGSLTSGVWNLASKSSGFAIEMAKLGASEAERRAMVSLKRRLRAASEDHEDFESAGESGSSDESWLHSSGRSPEPAAIMTSLLHQALEQSPAQAQEKLRHRMICALLPDEARILSSLSDGRSASLVGLAASQRVGAVTQRWLDNLSSVGREAGVQLKEQVPYYIANLRLSQSTRTIMQTPFYPQTV